MYAELFGKPVRWIGDDSIVAYEWGLGHGKEITHLAKASVNKVARLYIVAKFLKPHG